MMICIGWYRIPWIIPQESSKSSFTWTSSEVVLSTAFVTVGCIRPLFLFKSPGTLIFLNSAARSSFSENDFVKWSSFVNPREAASLSNAERPDGRVSKGAKYPDLFPGWATFVFLAVGSSISVNFPWRGYHQDWRSRGLFSFLGLGFAIFRLSAERYWNLLSFVILVSFEPLFLGCLWLDEFRVPRSHLLWLQAVCFPKRLGECWRLSFFLLLMCVALERMRKR